MGFTLTGQSWTGGDMDDIAHRSYGLRSVMVSPSVLDGPAQAFNCPGLPIPGAYWAIGNDRDDWAWCHWKAKATPLVKDEPGNWFAVDNEFSTKPFPPGNGQRCNQNRVQDPVLEPPRISGSFVKYTEETTVDRFGRTINYSSWEQIRSPQADFDRNRPTVKIEQNVPLLGLEVFGPMIDTVNAFPLWGLPRRCVKLSSVTWELKYYGQCYGYYTRSFEFDINAETFDKDILDQGTQMLFGRWDATTGNYVVGTINGRIANPFNPAHFMRAIGRDGNAKKMILNGGGLPAGAIITQTVGNQGNANVYMKVRDLDEELSSGHNDLLKILPLRKPSTIDNWVKLVDSPVDYIVPVFGIDNIPEWQPRQDTARYPVGSVRKYNPGGQSQGNVYVQISPKGGRGLFPPDTPPDDDEPYWLQVTPADKGVYDSTMGYAIGDYVTIAYNTMTFPGLIHVEKYQESDFLQLGIPAIIGH